MTQGVLLALDPAKRCGWARTDGQYIRSGTFDAGGDGFGPDAVAFREWLVRKIQTLGVVGIAVETPFSKYGGGQKTTDVTERWQHWQHGCILEVAARLSIPVTEVASQSWRKHFLGTGRAPKWVEKRVRREWWKDQAIQRCRLLGLRPKTNDEAEAIGILDYYRAMQNPAYGARTGNLLDLLR